MQSAIIWFGALQYMYGLSVPEFTVTKHLDGHVCAIAPLVPPTVHL